MSKRAALNKASKDATQKKLKFTTKAASASAPAPAPQAQKTAWEPPVLEEDDFGHEEEEEAEEDEQQQMPMDDVADAVEAMSMDHNYLSERYLVANSLFTPEKYERPALLENGSVPRLFMHTDTTYGIVDKQLEIRLWAITQQGHSCLVRVRGFTPYFYVDVGSQWEAEMLRERLEGHLQTKYNGKKPRWAPNYIDTFVVAIEPVRGCSLCGYHKGTDLRTMYKFYLCRPSYVAVARDCFEYVNQAVCTRKYATYEGNVAYELRYMIDAKINGCEWLQLSDAAAAAGCVNVKVSSAQYEFLVNHNNVPITAIRSSEKGDLAPMRFLSYDIEVLRKKRGFPTAKEDPVIMIAAALQVVGIGIVHQVQFCLKSRIFTDGGKDTGSFMAREGVSVYAFDTEAAMLLAFSQYIQACDPEALTGWNISNFDLPFLAERAKQLAIFDEWMSFSRINDKPVWIRQKTFQSKAYGAKTSNEMMCEGRFDHDGLTYMLRGVMEKFRSYKLNFISKKVLNDQKLDVDHTQIPTLYEGTDEDRTRLAHYCLQDTLLPLRLLEKLMAVINGIEQARVTGVPIKWLLERGQGIKTQSNLLRYKQPCEFAPSRSAKSNTEVTGGGDVKEPLRGFYQVPLASLDFASLYPSIMIAYNICFSTKVELSWARANLKPEDYWIPYPSIDKKTPEMLAEEAKQAEIERAAGIKRKKKSKKERERKAMEAQFAGMEPDFCFVKRHIRQGVLPLLLETLLDARRNVKKMMGSDAAKKDKLYYSVLDGRQLALKVVCNSVYGFLKAFILTDKDLMSAVTSYGRNMIYKVHDVIKTEFADNDVVDCAACRAMGIDPEIEPKTGEVDLRPRTRTKAFIVYGDTDSVMVNFGDITLADCARLGAAAAKMCTDRMEKPNSLAFETIKLRTLYLNKKRYAALEIEKIIPGEHMNDAIKRGKLSVKGLEGKRRDNAPIGSDTQNAVIKILLKEGNVEKAEELVRQVISDLLTDKVDMSKLIISKGLSKTEEQYLKSGSKQQHVELQRRMRKRSRFTGEAVPETGDRVPFIIKADTATQTASRKEKASELSEDPIYAQKEGVPINKEYYIHKQIWPAVSFVMRYFDKINFF
ncbi:MAG: hypothetical protein K2Q45_06720 [Nitrosomonas sp.]|nr:hypothetical protein [Nitrosomonas sp.]